MNNYQYQQLIKKGLVVLTLAIMALTILLPIVLISVHGVSEISNVQKVKATK